MPAWDSSSPINVIIIYYVSVFFVSLYFLSLLAQKYNEKNNKKINTNYKNTCWPREDRVENREAEAHQAQSKCQRGSKGREQTSCYTTKIRVLI